jgi:hypothetical protein
MSSPTSRATANFRQIGPNPLINVNWKSQE